MIWAGYHSKECGFGKPHLTCTDRCYYRQDELEVAWIREHPEAAAKDFHGQLFIEEDNGEAESR